MRVQVQFRQWCEVYYYNCLECGKPMFDEYSRRLGWCGCGTGRKKKPTERVALPKILDVYDPYGQVIGVK